jgi:hypothetical protein
MKVSMETKLGAFPVTQQVVGAWEFTTAFVSAIHHINKIANAFFLHFCGEFAQRGSVYKSNPIGKLSHDGERMLHGLLTMMPVVGSIMNGLKWYKIAGHQEWEREDDQGGSVQLLNKNADDWTRQDQRRFDSRAKYFDYIEK